MNDDFLAMHWSNICTDTSDIVILKIQPWTSKVKVMVKFTKGNHHPVDIPFISYQSFHSFLKYNCFKFNLENLQIQWLVMVEIIVFKDE